MALRIPLYQLDVFAERLFTGNPAAVCPLQAWLPDATMQAIAAENNLSETAFFVADETGEADFLLRWFTPTVEVELCGHATLASGHVVLEALAWPRDRVCFRTLKAGVLQVERGALGLWLDLPARPPQALEQIPAGLPEALGAQPVQVLQQGGYWLVVYDSARTIEGLRPDIAALRRLPAQAICVTAPGRRRSEDFVSRFFAPALGVDEDPVTG
ncbi:MAG TPA: PhzF family phenazine biosynthesis protein, partial [Solimonas sp.]|nr:PhzF family phenazine biosynthesis protein [Solimonas sp.]